ncbi:MobF family relaxase [Nocardioides sp. NPDC006303]|uniref:MobF family relaxase n=1 Tax=Nocardioides sp. NPDC006303 TaxID=3156747 RepID=UPI0033AA36BF
MTIHKLAAGSGYEYLTRQVAAQDSTELGDMALADYYAARGEAPGRWVGSGLTGLGCSDTGALAEGDLVTAEQMGHLFGTGEHPVTGRPLGRRQRSDGVAGFDLTFSPVKSVSTLWAVASPNVARAIEYAHNAAVADALAYLEHEVLFTREGADGARQVETRGLIAAAFVHRDSRAGDPDLHTHVAVANKVQARASGKWLSVYGVVLFQHAVAISETYNTALEARLHDVLGVRFAERPASTGRRSVREIVGVDADLCSRWSRRGSDINDLEHELTNGFVRDHGRQPTEKERLALVQRANLETRTPKHEPRAESEQRAAWRGDAAEVLGGDAAIGAMVRKAIRPAAGSCNVAATVDPATIRAIAIATITELEIHRATWQIWHLKAEAERQIRTLGLATADALPHLVCDVVEAAKRLSVHLTPELDPITQSTAEPPGMRRSDGTSVYRHTGADRYTSQRILNAEDRIVQAAGRTSDFAFTNDEVEIAILESAVNGIELNRGQHDLLRDMAGSSNRVRLALAPAGTGKTTAVRVLTRIWSGNGYAAVGLAPSAAAAAVLGEATGITTDTLAKLDWELLKPGRTSTAGISQRITSGTLVVIDEAGLADTLTLDRVIDHCLAQGAIVRLLGDDQQLAAVGAGGILRDIADRFGAARLNEVVRFADPTEAAASLDLREGDLAALGFYLDQDRLHTADQDGTISDVLDAWHRDRTAGLDSLMLASTRDLVAHLNRRARADRLAGMTPKVEVDLADGNRASVGDTVITRLNDRRLRVAATDWVKNGDRWTITHVRRGALTVQHTTTGLKAVLPAEYVADHVELGYASTVHTAQGITADVMHGIVTGREDRQILYTMLTRGRHENHAHIITEPDATAECDQHPLPGLDEQLTATQTLENILARDGAAASATTVLRRGRSNATRLQFAATRYADAVATGSHHVLGNAWEDALEAAGPGPLPWLAAVPFDVARHEKWGPYLAACARHVTESARRFHADLDNAGVAVSEAGPHGWVDRARAVLGDLREPVALWRAAHGVPEDDRRPTGPPVTDPVAARYQRDLLRQVRDRCSEGVRAWQDIVLNCTRTPDEDTQGRGEALELARRLDALQRHGYDASRLLRRALARGPLPAEHAAAALTYRVRKLSPTPSVPRARDGRRRALNEPLPQMGQQANTEAPPSMGL